MFYGSMTYTGIFITLLVVKIIQENVLHRGGTTDGLNRKKYIDS
jgi:hypothetical protein